MDARRISLIFILLVITLIFVAEGQTRCRRRCRSGSSCIVRRNREACISSICLQQKVVGPCRARKRRFYFDLSTGRCRPFYYGGCRGSANNFMSRRSCRRSCRIRRF